MGDAITGAAQEVWQILVNAVTDPGPWRYVALILVAVVTVAVLFRGPVKHRETIFVTSREHVSFCRPCPSRLLVTTGEHVSFCRPCPSPCPSPAFDLRQRRSYRSQRELAKNPLSSRP